MRKEEKHNNIRDNSRMVKNMVMGNIHGRVEKLIKECGSRGRSKVKEFIFVKKLVVN